MNTLEQIEQYAATQGIALTPRDRAAIAAAQQAERARLEAAAPKRRDSFADRFNAAYPKFLAAIVGIGETVLTLSQTIITAFGVPVVLMLLLIVEHHRVVEGILLFDPNPTFAGFAAAALVALNLVLEFLTHYIEHKAGYSEARSQRWSLRIWSINMAYRLGLGDRWQPMELSPAARYKGLLRLVTFTILALALVGSMRNVIAESEGVWHAAIVAIVTESSLLLMMTWLGGLLFAAAAVLSAQGLSRYVAIRCVEILASMDARQNAITDPHADAVDRAGAMAALAIINATIQKRETARARRSPTPTSESASTVDDDDTQEAPAHHPNA